MSIKLAITGRPSIEIDVENITIGSDPSCTVAFEDSSDVMPKHAVIRKIAGRWLIEVRDAPSVYVGDTEPKRLHWLIPGDQIRLTENGPAITFEPSTSDSPPLVPSGSVRQSIDDVIDEVLMLRENDAPQPDTKPVPVHIPSGSKTIPTTKPPSSHTIRAVNSGSHSGSTVTGHAAVGPRHRHVDNQSPNQSSSDEPPTGVPVLTRTSWTENDSLTGDEFSNDRELTPEQAELRWIVTVVLRTFGVGIAVLVVWLIVSTVWKSLAPTKVTPSTPLSETVEQPVAIPNPVTPTPAVPVHPAPAQIEKTKPPKEKPERVKTPLKAMTESPDAEQTTGPIAPVKPVKPVVPNGVGKKPKTSESTSDDNVASQSPSPMMQAVQESIYAVVVDDPLKSRRIQIGTAWAASRRYLVTTATVVNRIEEYQQNGMIASVAHFANGKSFRIKSKRLHETHSKALESAEDAREKKDDEQYSKDRAIQLRFDLGVLDIGRSERLPYHLAINEEPLEDSKESVFIMVGLPYLPLEDDSASSSIDPNSLKERRCKKPAAGIPLQDKQMGLTIQFPLDTYGNLWSGSPVLNQDQKVIGVYSQLAMPKQTVGKSIKPVHGVVWIGRLNEFASDIE